MTVLYADGVFEELVSLSFFIAEADEDAAQRFLDACDETFRFLADNRFCCGRTPYLHQWIISRWIVITTYCALICSLVCN